MDGWSENKNDEADLKIFWNKRDALTVESNFLLWGHRMIIPKKLQPLVLEELHHSHFGSTCMKALARSFVWWPDIDKEIDEITKCRPCLETGKNPHKITLTPWAWPTVPWHRIHADFFGPLFGKMKLVIVKSHSKQPEAVIVSSKNEKSTIQVFEDIFARHGYPAHLVTDNYSTSHRSGFQTLIKRGGYVTVPPHFTTRSQTVRQKILLVLLKGK
jgi:hypothetical protein